MVLCSDGRTAPARERSHGRGGPARSEYAEGSRSVRSAICRQSRKLGKIDGKEDAYNGKQKVIFLKSHSPHGRTTVIIVRVEAS